MQRILLASLFLVFCGHAAWGFSWKSKPSAELYADMLQFAATGKEALKGTPLAPEVDKFLAATKEKHAAEPGAWMRDIYQFAGKILEKYPPTAKFHPVREYALRLLDYPPHFRYGPNNGESEAMNVAYYTAQYIYYSEALDKVIKEVATAKVGPGEAKIWKIYCNGHIIKTRKHVIGIDISCGCYPFFTGEIAPELRAMAEKRCTAVSYPGVPGKVTNPKNALAKKSPWILPIFTDASIHALAELMDVLFISHAHGDHFISALNTAMCAKNKTVVAPTGVGTYNTAPIPLGNGKFAKPALNPVNPQNYKVIYGTDGKAVQLLPGVKFWAIKGAQRKVLNNTYLIEIDGIRIAQNGDNDQHDKDAALAKLPAANIIMAACWNNMANMVNVCRKAPGAAKARQVLIPYHENELGHRVEQRESYWEEFTQGGRLPACKSVPCYPLGCGECLTYPEKNARPAAAK